MIRCGKWTFHRQQTTGAIGLALAVILMTGPEARADYVTATVDPINFSKVDTFSFVLGTDHETAYATAIHWTVTGGNSGLPTHFTSYCDDLKQYVYAPGGPYTYQIVDPQYTPDDNPSLKTPTTAVGMGAADAKLIREFWGTFYSQVNSADTEAAFQIGLWDIANNSHLSLLNGNFTADPLVYGTKPSKWPSFLQTAQDWLTQLKNGQHLGYEGDLVGLQSATVQDQLTVLPVPPGLTLMGIGALGLMLNGWRRRRAVRS